MRKPIISVQGDFSEQEIHEMFESLKGSEVEKEYYFLILRSEQCKVQMFSDQEMEPIELDKLQADIMKKFNKI